MKVNHSIGFDGSMSGSKTCNGLIYSQKMGGVETGSMYMQYVQGISPNIPAHTTFIEILYKIFNGTIAYIDRVP